MKLDFLPQGLELIKTERPYWKMKEMKEGDNKLRIVGRPVAGWIDWHDKTPVRYRPENKPKVPYDLSKPVKPFWVCHVWDYAREGLYVIEFTQSSILKSLNCFASDEDWGDFTKYDLKIKKEGSGIETRYTLTPLPHKDLSEKIKVALKESPVNLNALYSGGDPWTDLEDGVIDPEIDCEIPKEFESLRIAFEKMGTDVSRLVNYLNEKSEENGQSIEKICSIALAGKEMTEQFRRNYVKYTKSFE